MTSSVAGLRRSSKALAKAKFVPKRKVMLRVWWSVAHLIHYSFLNPGETIISEKYASKLMRCIRTSMPTASIGQQKGLNSPQ